VLSQSVFRVLKRHLGLCGVFIRMWKNPVDKYIHSVALLSLENTWLTVGGKCKRELVPLQTRAKRSINGVDDCGGLSSLL